MATDMSEQSERTTQERTCTGRLVAQYRQDEGSVAVTAWGRAAFILRRELTESEHNYNTTVTCLHDDRVQLDSAQLTSCAVTGVSRLCAAKATVCHTYMHAIQALRQARDAMRNTVCAVASCCSVWVSTRSGAKGCMQFVTSKLAIATHG